MEKKVNLRIFISSIIKLFDRDHRETVNHRVNYIGQNTTEKFSETIQGCFFAFQSISRLLNRYSKV